ncbi:transcription factor/nuclear export subunit protein 2-domain-containing protein [Lipomyces oligophaga]|uniref:transcription factor/nuclear export subunit protein 2-domain-containing protein n=1 Tax=Lipomyces oligophaga TaxID=45792 RepID=UPI0034CE9EEB
MEDHTISLKRKRDLDDATDQTSLTPSRTASPMPPPNTADPPLITNKSPNTNNEADLIRLLALKWTVLDDTVLEYVRNADFDSISQLISSLHDSEKTDNVYIFLYELVTSVFVKRLEASSAASALNSLIQNGSSLDSSDLIDMTVDILSLFPYSELLKEFMKALQVDNFLYQTRLDVPVLNQTDWAIPLLDRRIIRANTALLYKQKRFNLLREESEGYAKLIVEIHTASYSTNNMDLVPKTVETITSLIGYFDLDPNRALDIFLDIFAFNVVANSQFYLAVLKSSLWWPSTLAVANKIEDISIGGNSIAASLLGFKLSFHSKSGNTPENLIVTCALLIKEGFISLGALYPHVNPTDEEQEREKEEWKSSMENIAYLSTASALALAPVLDLDPRDRTDNSQETLSAQEPEKPTKPKSFNSPKAHLTFALLSVGALWPALYILSKFPFLPGPYSNIADTLNVLMSHVLTPLYDQLGQPSLFSNLAQDGKKWPTQIRKSSGKITFKLVEPGSAASRRVLSHIKHSERSDQVYRIFYDGWSDGLSLIHNIEDLLFYSDLLLKFNGPHVGRDPALFTKLCRIINHNLQLCEQEDPSSLKYDKEFWMQYFRTYMLPSLSLIEANPGVMHEVWLVLEHYDHIQRYSLYGEWSNVLLKNIPELRVASTKAEKETKNILKRLSKTNVREMMRQLAHVLYANPVTSLAALVSQVESYDNLIELVVEAALYFTEIGWDVLPFVIMMQLSSGRNTMQGDGLTGRKWLQSLSTFTGRLCRQYSFMDPSPLLQYLRCRLHQSNSSDILLLQEIIQQMGGIATLSNLTDSQLEGLSCGPYVRSEVLTTIGDERHLCKTSSVRLLSSFLKLDLVSEMFVLLAQQYKTAVFMIPDHQAHSKILGARSDDLAVIIFQFIELVNMFLLSDGDKKFADIVISVPELCNKYGVNPAVAFALWREKLSHDIRGSESRKAKGVNENDCHDHFPVQSTEKEEEDLENGEVNEYTKTEEGEIGSDLPTVGDVEMKDIFEKRSENPNEEMVKIESEEQLNLNSKSTDVAMQDSGGGLKEEDTASTQAITKLQDESLDKVKQESEMLTTWHPILEPIINELLDSYLEGDWQYLTKGLFVTFYQLSLYDIQMPMSRYSSELDKIKSAIRALDAEKSSVSHSATRIAKREKLTRSINAIQGENRAHLTHIEQTRNRLRHERDHWFEYSEVSKAAIDAIEAPKERADFEISVLLKQAETFLLRCVLPRALFSPMDAIFCAKFIKQLHMLGTKNFRTVAVYNVLFSVNQIMFTISSCTPNEAENYGRLLNELLVDVSRWHAAKAVYVREGLGRVEENGQVVFLPGMRVAINPIPVSPMDDPDKEATEGHVMPYVTFKKLAAKWHASIRKAIDTCLSSKDYIQRRNAIIVLKNTNKTFPAIDAHGRALLTLINDISKNEERGDLKLASTALYGLMKKQSSTWIGSFRFKLTDEDYARKIEQEKADAAAKSAAAADARAKEEQAARAEAAKNLESENLNKTDVETSSIKNIDVNLENESGKSDHQGKYKLENSLESKSESVSQSKPLGEQTTILLAKPLGELSENSDDRRENINPIEKTPANSIGQAGSPPLASEANSTPLEKSKLNAHAPAFVPTPRTTNQNRPREDGGNMAPPLTNLTSSASSRNDEPSQHLGQMNPARAAQMVNDRPSPGQPQHPRNMQPQSFNIQGLTGNARDNNGRLIRSDGRSGGGSGTEFNIRGGQPTGPGPQTGLQIQGQANRGHNNSQQSMRNMNNNSNNGGNPGYRNRNDLQISGSARDGGQNRFYSGPTDGGNYQRAKPSQPIEARTGDEQLPLEAGQQQLSILNSASRDRNANTPSAPQSQGRVLNRQEGSRTRTDSGQSISPTGSASLLPPPPPPLRGSSWSDNRPGRTPPNMMPHGIQPAPPPTPPPQSGGRTQRPQGSRTISGPVPPGQPSRRTSADSQYGSGSQGSGSSLNSRFGTPQGPRSISQADEQQPSLARRLERVRQPNVTNTVNLASASNGTPGGPSNGSRTPRSGRHTPTNETPTSSPGLANMPGPSNRDDHRDRDRTRDRDREHDRRRRDRDRREGDDKESREARERRHASSTAGTADKSEVYPSNNNNNNNVGGSGGSSSSRRHRSDRDHHHASSSSSTGRRHDDGGGGSSEKRDDKDRDRRRRDRHDRDRDRERRGIEGAGAGSNTASSSNSGGGNRKHDREKDDNGDRQDGDEKRRKT